MSKKNQKGMEAIFVQKPLEQVMVQKESRPSGQSSVFFSLILHLLLLVCLLVSNFTSESLFHEHKST